MIELYWSRKPGNFVNKTTGESYISLIESGTLPLLGTLPKFTGTVREWYETLVETCIDARNQAVRAHKIKVGEGNRVELRVGPDVHCILQACVLYKSDGTIGRLFTVKEDKGLTNRIMVGPPRRTVASVIVKDM